MGDCLGTPAHRRGVVLAPPPTHGGHHQQHFMTTPQPQHVVHVITPQHHPQLMGQPPGTVAAAISSLMSFHHVHGHFVSLTNNYRTASRIRPRTDFNNAVVFSSRPLKDNELFEVQIDGKLPNWSGSIEMGVTAVPPELLQLPETLTALKHEGVWVLSGSAIFVAGESQNEYSFNMDALQTGAKVGVMRSEHGTLHYFLNGEDQGVAAHDIPEGVHAMVDIYGQCTQVSITANSGIKPAPSIDVTRIHTALKVHITDSSDSDTSSDSSSDEDDDNDGGNGSDEENEEEDRVIAVRVIRGPDWSWGDQDGGAGGVGTGVVGVRKDGWMDVRWDVDGDEEYKYRIGAQGKHDLRLFDIAPSGMRHAFRTDSGITTMQCDVCDEVAIRGFRWKCQECDDYDLCTKCYMTDKHDLDHAFIRYDTPNDDEPASLPPRRGSPRMKTFGIFEGAVVVRGPDWKWGNQDVGVDGKQGPGVVLSIRDFTETGCNAGAQVLWAGFDIELYRVGFQGKVDLVAAHPALFAHAYYQHLPLIAVDEDEIEDDVGEALLRAGMLFVLGMMTEREEKIQQEAEVKRQESQRQIMRKPRPVSTMRLKPSQARAGRQSILFESAYQELQPSATRLLTDPAQPCRHVKVAKELTTLLQVHDDFFDASQDKCFCEPCCGLVAKNPTYSQGRPPKLCVVPFGWCKLGLKLQVRATPLKVMENWHVAYHGTTIQAVKQILLHEDLLMPGEVGLSRGSIHEREGHYRDDWKPDNFDTKQVFVSPSIKYAGMRYAQPFRFKDESRKDHLCRVAFQVRIQPGSYEVGEETVLDEDKADVKIDQHFSNQELEWSTKHKRVIILTGLLVKIDT